MELADQVHESEAREHDGPGAPARFLFVGDRDAGAAVSELDQKFAPVRPDRTPSSGSQASGRSTVVCQDDGHGMPQGVVPESRSLSLELGGNDEHAREIARCPTLRCRPRVRRPARIGAHRQRRCPAPDSNERIPVARMKDAVFRRGHVARQRQLRKDENPGLLFRRGADEPRVFRDVGFHITAPGNRLGGRNRGVLSRYHGSWIANR